MPVNLLDSPVPNSHDTGRCPRIHSTRGRRDGQEVIKLIGRLGNNEQEVSREKLHSETTRVTATSGLHVRCVSVLGWSSRGVGEQIAQD